jgi:5-methyltetrahydrofolate--homocysteine methyltransferase
MIVIAEKINASRSAVKAIIESRDTASLLELAKKQADAGANYIDVNVGTGTGTREDEMESMRWAVDALQKDLDTPLSIDSGDPAVLEAGLAMRDGRPSLINSTKGEEESLEEVMPLAGKYGFPVVALAMGEGGLPKTVEDRIGPCEKIVASSEKYGVPIENVFFDTLVLPVSTDVKQGLITLDAIRLVKEKFPGSKTVLGVSNVSYGLPGRKELNAAFLTMAIYAGLDAAIIDPTVPEMMGAVRRAEVLAGKDRHCRRYVRAFRNK